MNVVASRKPIWHGSSIRDGEAGLGLAIARAVVEFHIASIWARNVAADCRFDIALPAQPSLSGQE
jgi:signal transduction histidine kinase